MMFISTFYLKLGSFVDLWIISFLMFFSTSERRKKFPLRLTLGTLLMFAFYMTARVIELNYPKDVALSVDWFSVDSLMTFLLDAVSFIVFYATFKDSFHNALGKFFAAMSANYIFKDVTTIFIERGYIQNGLTLEYQLLRSAIFIALSVIFYFLFIRRFRSGADFLFGTPKLSAFFFIFYYIVTHLLQVFALKIFFMQNFSMNYAAIIIHIFVCGSYILLLYMLNRLNCVKRDRDIMSVMVANQREQYAVSKEMIEIINQKYHDMKYQLSAIRNSAEGERSTERMLQETEIYDSIARTGNDALNVVLTEKNMLCKKEGIRFSYIADAQLLSFMEIVDIYIILGNAISNAIEYLKQVQDSEKRIIILNIKRVESACLIRIDNYFENDGKLVMEKGLPRTTKADKFSHGYGLKSLKLIAEKYGGRLNVVLEENLFSVRIVIPLNDK